MRLATQCLLTVSLQSMSLLSLWAADAAPLETLPASAGMVTQDGRTQWHALTVVGTNAERAVVLAVGGRQVTVARSLVAQDDGAAAAALPALMERAIAAGLDPSQLRLDRGLLTGVHLRGSDVLVLADIILRRDAVAPVAEKTTLTALTDAATALTKELPTSPLTALGQNAVRRVLELIAQAAIGEDDCSPELIRHLLHAGWLDRDLAAVPTWKPLRAALAEALKLQVVQRWSADGAVLCEYSDAFSRRVFTLNSASGSARLLAHPPGMHDAPPRMVVQRFAAGVDPLSAGMPDSAEVWWGRQPLAQWSAAAGLTADRARWRTVLADEGPGVGDDTLEDWRPPHVVLTAIDGSVLALCTAHGVLRPPLPGVSDDHERFLADAARLSPDAQHLDLIGQYLFSYVHDSPDPQRPWLIGVQGLTGDIHQTVGQTVSTVCAGLMRGDCDDLSEVYHDLLTRQGHLPQVFSLPRHAVCAWSLKQGDLWTTHVLHTGQPLAFHGETLDESIDQAFTHFDDTNTNRGTLVHLLLRFAGENTRSQWQLGSRIMYDAEYARTMIAVQRNWHFHTHARGITTMQRMIAEGDDASANWSELGGLYRRTGQWDLALAAQRACLARITDPSTRLDAWMSLIALQVQGKHHAETAREARELLAFVDAEFPDDEGPRRQIVQRIVSLLSAKDHATLQRDLVLDRILPAIDARRPGLSDWARTQFDRRAWSEHGESDRDDAALVMSAAFSGLEKKDARLADDEDLQKLVAFSEHWMTELAFLDTGERDDVMDSYATVGHFAGVLLGEANVDGLLEHAAEPTAWLTTHQQRTRGVPQFLRDLPWIRISVPYWSSRLGTLLSKEDTLLDEASALQVIARLTAAASACERLDIRTTGLERTQLWVRLVEALIRRDEAALSATLRTCAQRQDRSSDELVTDTLVSLARHLPSTWFRRVLALWDEHAATKPGYFAIAWGCAIADAVPQALEAGALAARRFADDPEFVAEFIYLQQVLAGGEQP